MSKIDTLRKLTTKPAAAEHQEEYDKQTSDKADDRSFCLLLSSMLENSLDRAIDAWFGDQSPELRKSLYLQEGPLGTFSRKIIVATALQIVGLTTQENFRIIRHVRNAFAHAKIPITFNTPAVSAVCSDLIRINIFDPPEYVDQMPELTARARFETVLHETMLRLARYSGHDPHYKDATGKERTIEAGALP